MGWIERRRLKLEEALTNRGLAHTFSLARYRLHNQVARLIAEHARGEALDVGSGRSPFRRFLDEHCSNVVSVDVEDRSGQTDLLVDVQDMPQIGDGSFDSALCTQVLEHVPRPWAALAELARVLRPGGTLILSVPHLSAIHEAPHDYYRYTRFGLEELLGKSGFQVDAITAAGGLMAFLGHGTSYLFLSVMGAVPLLSWPAWVVNYALFVRLLGVIDGLLGMRGIYPCNYVVVALKPPAAGERC